MAAQFTTAQRDAWNNSIISTVGSGAIYNIYSGTVPANVAAGLGGATLLASLTVSGAFGTESSGVLTLTNPASATAGATGTASFFRITTSGGSAQIQGTAGTSGTDMILSNGTITNGVTVSITGTNTITAPGA